MIQLTTSMIEAFSQLIETAYLYLQLFEEDLRLISK
nr:MAG TPA: hypothetical protein [Caudoviricetes sp.]